MKKFLIVLLLLLSCSQADEVCIGENCFEVEVVSEGEERLRGLMFREHLDEDKGMLFIFDRSGVYPFWMKNTLIPLDIIWINEDMQIVYISRNTQPCEEDPCPNYDPEREALYVLEINSGLAVGLGIEEGNVVEFKLKEIY